MLVLTAVSSRNTSRAGSSSPCSRIQRRRARVTSARCRSAACSVFSESNVVSIEKNARASCGCTNPPLAPHRNGLYQSPVGLFGNHRQYLRRELVQRRNASSARLCCGASGLAPVLHPLDRRARAHLVKFRSLPPRRTHLHRFHSAFSQLAGTGLRHRPTPERKNQCAKTRSSKFLWESPDSDRSGTALKAGKRLSTRLIAYERKGTGLASKPGKRSRLDSRHERKGTRRRTQHKTPLYICRSCGKAMFAPTLATCPTRSTRSYHHPKMASQATSSFGVRRQANRFRPVSTPTLWYFIPFRKSKCICAAPLVTKITRGTVPGPGSSKAPNQAKILRDRRTSLLSRKHHNHVTDHDAYIGPAAVS
jgi:hypothetical protein